MIISWDIGIYNLSYCILEKRIISNIVTSGSTDCSGATSNDGSTDGSTDGSGAISGATSGATSGAIIKNFNNYSIKDWGIINIADKINIKKNKSGVYMNIPDILDRYDDFLRCKYVLIENQPCMKNPTMKSIQMILYSYFLIKGIKDNNSNIEKVEFISPMNKLKVYDGPKLEFKVKSKYTIRKKKGIAHCRYFLENNEKLSFFNSNKKKDDLADSFLQALYYIKKNKLL